MSTALNTKRIANRKGRRFSWKVEPKNYYPDWEEDYKNPLNPNFARNQPGCLSLFLSETTIPTARALLASIEQLQKQKYEDRGEQWHESYRGVLRIFRNLHDAGRHFYNNGRVA